MHPPSNLEESEAIAVLVLVPLSTELGCRKFAFAMTGARGRMYQEEANQPKVQPQVSPAVG